MESKYPFIRKSNKPRILINLSQANKINEYSAIVFQKFSKQEYKKKLEPYFIMEGCSEHVYQISEIILNHDTADKNAVYVMFDTYYGDLHTYMKEKKRLGEAEARHIFKQCVQAVQQCHENGIIVRDIKLKKFIFTNPERYVSYIDRAREKDNFQWHPFNHSLIPYIKEPR